MKKAKLLRKVSLAALAITLVSGCSTVGEKALNARLRPMYTPGLPNSVECGSPGSGASDKCDGGGKEWHVRVIGVSDEANVTVACVALFMYNHLNIRTSGSKEKAKVTWKLVGLNDSKFVPPGIEFTSGDSPDPTALFENPSIFANDKKFKVETKHGATGGMKFNHLPKVQSKIGSAYLYCVGVDPTIGNSAN
jgi:hypothetical protein